MATRRKRRKAARRVAAPRNPLALPTRRLGQRVKASARTYRRRAKHRLKDEA